MFRRLQSGSRVRDSFSDSGDVTVKTGADMAKAKNSQVTRANRNFIPNHGDRYRHGEKISTAFAESAVNQVISKCMVKKQQMRWTESGARLTMPKRRAHCGLESFSETWRCGA